MAYLVPLFFLTVWMVCAEDIDRLIWKLMNWDYSLNKHSLSLKAGMRDAGLDLRKAHPYEPEPKPTEKFFGGLVVEFKDNDVY